MELQSKEMQILTVEKVLEEMERAEQYLMCWHVCWLEKYEHAVLPQEYFDRSNEENQKLDREVSKIDTHTETDEYKGIPLKHIVLGGLFSCDIPKIKWYAIETNNAERTITFENNGKITLSKNPSRHLSKIRSKLIDYEASYNVLSNDFKIEINITASSKPLFSSKQLDTDTILIQLSGHKLIRKYNGIEIIDDLSTGLRYIRITKKHNKENNASINFRITLNQHQEVESGTIEINTHKGNGKVNGTYRFNVSKQKGIQANFYSRKGIKINLLDNPMLLETASRLMLTSSTEATNSDIMITNFANATQKAIMKNLNERVVNLDSSDFNIDAVINAEQKAFDMLKCIKGEIPLQGLSERIDYCLSLFGDKKQLTSHSKVLKLVSSDSEQH